LAEDGPALQTTLMGVACIYSAPGDEGQGGLLRLPLG
jgi:hypothetical protein